MVHQQHQSHLNNMKLILFLGLRSAILLPGQIPTYRSTQVVANFCWVLPVAYHKGNFGPVKKKHVTHSMFIEHWNLLNLAQKWQGTS